MLESSTNAELQMALNKTSWNLAKVQEEEKNHTEVKAELDMASMDMNKDGKLTKDEFGEAFASRLIFPANATFDEVDANSDGILDLSELNVMEVASAANLTAALKNKSLKLEDIVKVQGAATGISGPSSGALAFAVAVYIFAVGTTQGCV
eukprot:gnl/TRDRNA2_/TRDRNA2_170258_c0_seq1.p2 gnl/TRDRNA2_/TRDRNA2_170258_c0~~gnl/TRDRNA2_/TRDRNA2_170258_c0_seq1.p2  ORF type:complete len:150 (+),score=46.56 gnl/TRDRNA2_/TRDRNA2_170258_c0_seq1:166-615(+)